MTLLEVSILQAFYGFGGLIVICEIGQRVTNAFEPIEDTFKEFDWYSFPMRIQRKLPIIWSLAQKPITLNCFGGISCNRESFKMVNLFENI